LQATLRKIEGTDFEIVKHDVSSHVAASLRQLRQAYTGLALALEREMKKGAPCELAPLINRELHESAIELAASERGMGALEDGSMTERRDRFEAAEKRFWRAFDADCEHHSTCPFCLANR
jgi:hypothetical protein